jgi:hypothetical protein
MMDIVLKIVTVLLFLVVFKNSVLAIMEVTKHRSIVAMKHGKTLLFGMYAFIGVVTLLELTLFGAFVKYVLL